ncbi:MAG TPA: DUF5989 family protein [Verrucomicrobiales bacterium]|nr:DUF5989 family protein [Verrucomicrobiales bacterium]
MTDPELGNEFVRAGEAPRESLPSQFLRFLAQNKKWWLLPIVVVLLLLGVLIMLGGTSLAPFIYPLF